MKRRSYAALKSHLLPGWRNAELFGQAKYLRDHPKRYALLVRAALEKLGLRYWEKVTAWNEYHHPSYQGQPVAAAFQMLDFVVHIKGQGALIVLIKNPNSLLKSNEKAAWQARLDFLTNRETPYLILPTSFTSQEYQLMISMSIRKHILMSGISKQLSQMTFDTPDTTERR